MFREFRSFGIVRATEEGGSGGERPRVEAIISTENIARDGAVIEADGWDFANYDRNPVVLYGHDDNSLPIARTIEREVKDKRLRALAEIDDEDEFAMRVYSKIQRGFLQGTSVRWRPLTWEWRKVAKGEGRHEDEPEEVLYFTEQELLEWSFVVIPSDADALAIRSVDGQAFDPEQFRDGARPPAGPRDVLLDHCDAISAIVNGEGFDPNAYRLDGTGVRTIESARDAIVRILPVTEPPMVIHVNGGNELDEDVLARVAVALR